MRESWGVYFVVGVYTLPMPPTYMKIISCRKLYNSLLTQVSLLSDKNTQKHFSQYGYVPKTRNTMGNF